MAHNHKVVGSNPSPATMYKENIKYKLIGYQPVGIDYNVERIVDVAEYRSGNWYRSGSNKVLCNFCITEIIEII